MKSSQYSAMKKRYTVMTVFGLIVLFAALLLTGIRAFALPKDDKKENTVYCTSITVRSGDTLWSIANQYSPDKSTEGINNYVDELCRMNHIHRSDMLKADTRLMVTYQPLPSLEVPSEAASEEEEAAGSVLLSFPSV